MNKTLQHFELLKEFIKEKMLIGIAVIANGLVLVFAGRDGHWTWWRLLIGILYVLFGIFVIAHPLVKDAPCIEGVDVEILTTEGGVEFVRTPDTCFENLSDWSYEPQVVEIDGLRQAYVDVGSGESGETILLLHGQPSWSYLYRKMIPLLEGAGHRVIAMDHLGMGRSDKPIDPDYYAYQGHVDRLEAFIQELELDEAKPTIFVQDWGSLIGLQVVGTHPDWFDRLVVGNGFLPRFQEGTTPFPLPEDPRITRNLFHQAILKLPAQQEPIDWEKSPPSLGVETDLNYFSLWIDYARNDERFRPEVFVEAHTYYDLALEEE